MGVTVDFSQYSEFFRRLELAAKKILNESLRASLKDVR